MRQGGRFGERLLPRLVQDGHGFRSQRSSHGSPWGGDTFVPVPPPSWQSRWGVLKNLIGCCVVNMPGKRNRNYPCLYMPPILHAYIFMTGTFSVHAVNVCIHYVLRHYVQYVFFFSVSYCRGRTGKLMWK